MEIEIMEESHNTSLDLWALKGFQKIMSNEEMDIYKTTTLKNENYEI
jgi:hypothetical protein